MQDIMTSKPDASIFSYLAYVWYVGLLYLYSALHASHVQNEVQRRATFR